MHQSVVLLSLVLISSISATQYYECIDIHNYRKFPGINNACGQLSDDWCSTNCAPFRKSCRYCQYTPYGDPRRQPVGSQLREDLEVLERWCSSQAYFSSAGGAYYPKIVASSYKQITHCSDCSGCSYQKLGPPGHVCIYANGTLADCDDDDDLAKRQEPVGNATESLDDTTPITDYDSFEPSLFDGSTTNAWVALGLPTDLVGSTGSNCTSLFPQAAAAIAGQYTTDHSSCTADSSDEPNLTITCTDASEIASTAEGAEGDFGNACDYYGGLMVDMVDNQAPSPDSPEDGGNDGGGDARRRLRFERRTC